MSASADPGMKSRSNDPLAPSSTPNLTGLRGVQRLNAITGKSPSTVPSPRVPTARAEHRQSTHRVVSSVMGNVPGVHQSSSSALPPLTSNHSNTSPTSKKSLHRNTTAATSSDSSVLVIDGENYDITKIKSILHSLKEEAYFNKERAMDAEREANQLRQTITKKDAEIHQLQREVDQLKSVLDRKMGSFSGLLATINEDSAMPGQGTAADTAATSASSGLGNRNKKQGVSGESGTSNVAVELRHHEKSIKAKQQIKEALQENQFLKHMEPSQMKEVVECMYEQTFRMGAFIIREGDTGKHIYVTAEGKLEVVKGGKTLGTMDVGRAFGELALLYDCPRTASVKALTDAKVWALDRQVFQTIMMKTNIQKAEESLKFLKSVNLLKALPRDKLQKLADVLESGFYTANQYIVREGEVGQTFFIIKSGEVRVSQLVQGSDTPTEVRTLGKGDYFGEKALLSDDVRTANVIAKEPGVEVLVLDRENFDHVIGNLNELKQRDYGDEQRGAKSFHRKQGDRSPTMMVQESAVSVLQTKQPSLVAPDNPYANIRLEDLDVITTLGMGGFGRVELVVWVHNRSKSFALKCLKKQHIVETKQQSHILEERNILLQVDCSFIVKLHKTFKDKKFVYMLLDAILGGEVWTILRDRNRFDDTICKFVVACVLEAFEYLHSRGIIYRDLKPENLLMDSQGYIKLCDFGFAKKIGRGRKTWTFCGTPEYVSPEIVLNKGHDFASDLWSLGILMFELLTGNPPFTGHDPMKTYNIIIKGVDVLEFPRYISPNAHSLIKKLCRENPAERLGYGKGGLDDIRQNKHMLLDSLFSLEIYVDSLRLLEGVDCLYPGTLLKVLDFDTVLVSQLEPVVKQRLMETIAKTSASDPAQQNPLVKGQLESFKEEDGSYCIRKGKSLLFRMKPETLCKWLHHVPLYLLVVDCLCPDGLKLVGVSTVSIAKLMDKIYAALWEHGSSKPLSFEDVGTFDVFSLMGKCIAAVALKVRLNCLGPSAAAHAQQSGMLKPSPEDDLLNALYQRMMADQRRTDQSTMADGPVEKIIFIDRQNGLAEDEIAAVKRELLPRPLQWDLAEDVPGLDRNIVEPPHMFYHCDALDPEELHRARFFHAEVRDKPLEKRLPIHTAKHQPHTKDKDNGLENEKFRKILQELARRHLGEPQKMLEKQCVWSAEPPVVGSTQGKQGSLMEGLLQELLAWKEQQQERQGGPPIASQNAGFVQDDDVHSYQRGRGKSPRKHLKSRSPSQEHKRSRQHHSQQPSTSHHRRPSRQDQDETSRRLSTPKHSKHRCISPPQLLSRHESWRRFTPPPPEDLHESLQETSRSKATARSNVAYKLRLRKNNPTALEELEDSQQLLSESQRDGGSESPEKMYGSMDLSSSSILSPKKVFTKPRPQRPSDVPPLFNKEEDEVPTRLSQERSVPEKSSLRKATVVPGKKRGAPAASQSLSVTGQSLESTGHGATASLGDEFTVVRNPQQSTRSPHMSTAAGTSNNPAAGVMKSSVGMTERTMALDSAAGSSYNNKEISSQARPSPVDSRSKTTIANNGIGWPQQQKSPSPTARPRKSISSSSSLEKGFTERQVDASGSGRFQLPLEGLSETWHSQEINLEESSNSRMTPVTVDYFNNGEEAANNQPDTSEWQTSSEREDAPTPSYSNSSPVPRRRSSAASNSSSQQQQQQRPRSSRPSGMPSPPPSQRRQPPQLYSPTESPRSGPTVSSPTNSSPRRRRYVPLAPANSAINSQPQKQEVRSNPPPAAMVTTPAANSLPRQQSEPRLRKVVPGRITQGARASFSPSQSFSYTEGSTGDGPQELATNAPLMSRGLGDSLSDQLDSKGDASLGLPGPGRGPGGSLAGSFTHDASAATWSMDTRGTSFTRVTTRMDHPKGTASNLMEGSVTGVGGGTFSRGPSAVGFDSQDYGDESGRGPFTGRTDSYTDRSIEEEEYTDLGFSRRSAAAYDSQTENSHQYSSEDER